VSSTTCKHQPLGSAQGLVQRVSKSRRTDETQPKVTQVSINCH
jgi:hypothetical protein